MRLWVVTRIWRQMRICAKWAYEYAPNRSSVYALHRMARLYAHVHAILKTYTRTHVLAIPRSRRGSGIERLASAS